MTIELELAAGIKDLAITATEEERLAEKIKDLGNRIRAAKSENKERTEWDAMLQEMLEAKAEYKKLTGIDLLSPLPRAKKTKKTRHEPSPSDILSDDLLGLVLSFLGPKQFCFVAGASRQFARVYKLAHNNETETSMSSVAESTTRTQFYLFHEMTYLGRRERRANRLKGRMRRGFLGRATRIARVARVIARPTNWPVVGLASEMKARAMLRKLVRSEKCTGCGHIKSIRPYAKCLPLLDPVEESLRENPPGLVGRSGMALFGRKKPRWHPCAVVMDNGDGTIKVQWDEDKKFTKHLPVEKFRLPEDSDDVDRDYVECVACEQFFFVDKVPLNEFLSVLAALDGDFAICPHCGDVIVKNGGCDHMKCRCRFDFSYSTGTAW